jgi:hypothetical protein
VSYYESVKARVDAGTINAAAAPDLSMAVAAMLDLLDENMPSDISEHDRDFLPEHLTAHKAWGCTICLGRDALKKAFK